MLFPFAFTSYNAPIVGLGLLVLNIHLVSHLGRSMLNLPPRIISIYLPAFYLLWICLGLSSFIIGLYLLVSNCLLINFCLFNMVLGIIMSLPVNVFNFIIFLYLWMLVYSHTLLYI